MRLHLQAFDYSGRWSNAGPSDQQKQVDAHSKSGAQTKDPSGTRKLLLLSAELN